MCVRFLRTQQCDKSQCLLVLDWVAGLRGCLVAWLSGFGFLLARMILAGILSVLGLAAALRRVVVV
jgi:hypothetical protein